MTLSASGQTGQGPLGAHLRFLPWLCLTRGGLEPFVRWLPLRDATQSVVMHLTTYAMLLDVWNE